MGIIQLPSAKLRSIMAKSNLVWDSEAISKTYQGAFLVLQTSRLQLVPYSPVWGAPRIFGGLEFPALPPAKWNSLVQNHPAFLRFQKVQLDDWVKLSSYTWWLSHYTSSHGSVEKWERHPIWVSFHLGWIFHSTMIMGERVSCFLPWITSQNLQGLDSGSQKIHGKNMMFREVATLLPLKILPKPNRPNTNITQITVQGSMFQRRYVRFKMLQTFRLHLPSLDSTSPITVHLPMQRNQLTRSLWSNTKKKEGESLCDKKCQFWWPTLAACHAFSTISCFSSCVRSCCVCSTRACNSCCVTSQDATSIGPWVTWSRTSSSFPKNQRWNIWNIRPLQTETNRAVLYEILRDLGVQPLICQLLPQNAPPTRSGWHAGLHLGYNRGKMVSYVGYTSVLLRW